MTESLGQGWLLQQKTINDDNSVNILQKRGRVSFNWKVLVDLRSYWICWLGPGSLQVDRGLSLFVARLYLKWLQTELSLLPLEFPGMQMRPSSISRVFTSNTFGVCICGQEVREQKREEGKIQLWYSPRTTLVDCMGKSGVKWPFQNCLQLTRPWGFTPWHQSVIGFRVSLGEMGPLSSWNSCARGWKVKGVATSTSHIWGNKAFIAMWFVSTAVMLRGWEHQVCAWMVGSLVGLYLLDFFKWDPIANWFNKSSIPMIWVRTSTPQSWEQPSSCYGISLLPASMRNLYRVVSLWLMWALDWLPILLSHIPAAQP